MQAYLNIKKDAMDRILKEFPRNSHIMQICMTTTAQGEAMRVDYTSLDQLGQDRPRRKSMLYSRAQVESFVDSFPKGAKVVGIRGLYGYPLKVIDGVAYAHGHVTRGSFPLKLLPIPNRVIQAVPVGYKACNIQLETNGVTVMSVNLELGLTTSALVMMDPPDILLKQKFEEAKRSEEEWLGYCAEYEFFMSAVKKCRQWRQCLGFQVRVALAETWIGEDEEPEYVKELRRRGLIVE